MKIFLFLHKYIMAKTDITPVEFIETTSTKLTTVQESHPGAFIHVNDENGDDTLYIGEDKVTDKFNVGFTPDSTPTREIGGLQASTIGTLKGDSISTILKTILLVQRTAPTRTTNVSATISYSGNKTIEVGTNLPSKSNVTVNTNKGKWSDGTVYAGTASVEKIMTPDKWGEPAEEGTYTIKAEVTFGPGGIPKDNYGDSCPDLQYQGSSTPITTSAIKITAVYPVYINDGSDITVMNKHIVDYIAGQTITVTVPPEVETPDPFKFRIQVPQQFTTVTVKQFNPLTQSYDISVPMVFVSGNTPMYERQDNTYTNTDSTKYQINLKK